MHSQVTASRRGESITLSLVSEDIQILSMGRTREDDWEIFYRLRRFCAHAVQPRRVKDSSIQNEKLQPDLREFHNRIELHKSHVKSPGQSSFKPFSDLANDVTGVVDSSYP